MNKISRKGFLKIAAAAAMSGVTAGALAACNAASGSTSTAASGSAAASGATGTYIPGTYEGTAEGISSTVKVTMTFSDSAVTDVVVDNFAVRIGEAHSLLALVGDGHGRGDDVGLTGFQGGENAVPRGVAEFNVQARFFGDGFQVVNGIPDHVLVFVKHFNGRPRRVGSHDEGFFGGIGQRMIVLLLRMAVKRE